METSGRNILLVISRMMIILRSCILPMFEVAMERRVIFCRPRPSYAREFVIIAHIDDFLINMDSVVWHRYGFDERCFVSIRVKFL